MKIVAITLLLIATGMPARSEICNEHAFGRFQTEATREFEVISSAKSQIVALRLLGELNARRGIPLAFWARSPLSPETGIATIYDTPWGDIAHVFAKSIPIGKDGPLEAETVAEIDNDGTVLVEWQVPVYSLILGVSGEELLVELNSTVCMSYDADLHVALAIKPDGTFRFVLEPTRVEPIQVECPEIPLSNDYGYSSCWIHRNSESELERILVYQGLTIAT